MSNLVAAILYLVLHTSVYTQVEATVYNACPKQTNSDYLTTADGSKIDTLMINDLRWVALSRDLLTRWGGNIDYGTKIYVISTDSRISGVWTVRDCMNARFTNRIDFLQCKYYGIYDKWSNLVVIKL